MPQSDPVKSLVLGGYRLRIDDRRTLTMLSLLMRRRACSGQAARSEQAFEVAEESS